MRINRTINDGKIDLSGWNFDSNIEEALKDAISATVQSALEIAIDDKCNAYLPVEYKYRRKPGDGHFGAPVGSADTIYVSLPLGSGDNNPTWNFTLTELVTKMMEDWLEEDKLDHAIRRSAEELRDKLRELADYLDNCLVHP